LSILPHKGESFCNIATCNVYVFKHHNIVTKILHFVLHQ